MGFTEDLKTIANPEHHAPAVGELDQRLHQGTEAGNGPTPEIIPVRKTTWQHQAIFRRKHTQVRILVPEHDHFMAQILLQGELHVSVAIGSRKYNNPEFHVQYLRNKGN